MPKAVAGKGQHKNILPFQFHGVDVSADEGDTKAVGDCPFCGKEGKWNIDLETTEWRCWSCPHKGNTRSFLWQLWEESEKITNGETKVLAANRGLLYHETLTPLVYCPISHNQGMVNSRL
jgi:hypothetical protein